MSIFPKLLNIQTELKAPKGQYNSFGKYNYRSCEDILEAVKPLCKAQGLCLTLIDRIQLIGERYYVEATATVIDIETGSNYFTTAYAREEETKKGMDSSQVTGTASSYARKYALNGLFDIDDTKDADTNEFKQVTTVLCPKCGKEIKSATTRNGTVWQPQQILNQYGMCPKCYKKGEENNGN